MKSSTNKSGSRLFEPTAAFRAKMARPATATTTQSSHGSNASSIPRPSSRSNTNSTGNSQSSYFSKSTSSSLQTRSSSNVKTPPKKTGLKSTDSGKDLLMPLEQEIQSLKTQISNLKMENEKLLNEHQRIPTEEVPMGKEEPQEDLSVPLRELQLENEKIKVDYDVLERKHEALAQKFEVSQEEWKQKQTFFESKIEKLEFLRSSAIKNLQDKVNELEGENSHLMNLKFSYENEIATLKGNHNEYGERLVQLKEYEDENEMLKEKIALLEKENQRPENEQLKSDFEMLKSYVKELEDMNTNLSQNLQSEEDAHLITKESMNKASAQLEQDNNLMNTIKEFEKMNEMLNEELSLMKNSNSDSMKTIEELRLKLLEAEESRKDLEMKYKSELETTQEKLRIANDHCVHLQQDLNESLEELLKLQETNEQLRVQIVSGENHGEKTEESNHISLQDKEEMKLKLETMEKEMAQYKKQIEDDSQLILLKSEQIQEMTEEITQFKEEIEQRQELSLIREEEIMQMKRQIEDLQSKHHDTGFQLQRLESEKEDLTNVLHQKTTEFESIHVQFNQLKDVLEEREQALSDSKLEIAGLKTNLDNLESRLIESEAKARIEGSSKNHPDVDDEDQIFLVQKQQMDGLKEIIQEQTEELHQQKTKNFELMRQIEELEFVVVDLREQISTLTKLEDE